MKNMVKPIKRIQLGKNGLTEAFFEQLKGYFINERMVKINILKSACRDKKEVKQISEEIVKRLGKKYRFRIVGYVITLSKFRRDVS